MKPLIAIVSCHRFKARADAQRATWVNGIKGIDYKFFLGGGDREPLEDEVFLDVPDDYIGLSWKTRAIMKWAVDNGYDSVFKCDDDTFVFSERLLNALPTTLYEGRVNHTNTQWTPRGWCSGFAYWLSGEALKIIANAPEPIHKAEDVWVGMILSQHNISPRIQPGFIVLSMMDYQYWYQYRDQVIATCEFKEGEMFKISQVMRNIPPHKDPDTRLGLMSSRNGIRIARFGEVLRRRR